MTTAQTVGKHLASAREALARELKVPVEGVVRKPMMRLLADGLMASLSAVRLPNEN
jgi:hypothetical protein